MERVKVENVKRKRVQGYKVEKVQDENGTRV